MQATSALNRANVTSPWDRVVAEKRDELSAAVRAIQRKDPRLSTIFSFPEDSQLSSFEEFEQSLERLCTTYSGKSVSRFVTEKVYPNLQTLQSFTDAISAATQSQSTASLCWGCILIVIKCGCIFTENLAEIMSQVEELQKVIPRCTLEAEIYPKNPGLRFVLEDLFRDFVDYCLVILKCLKRNPIANIVRSLFSSSMSRDLQGMRAKIQRHKQDFKAMTDTAMQKRLQEVHEHTSALSGATTHSNGPNTLELPIDTVTLPRNEGFVGREEELRTLHKFLVDERSSAGVVSCIVHGVGGYGKTQVALEYSYKYKEDYNAIFWVEAENNFVLLRSFGAIGRALKLFETEDIKQPEIEKTMAWLKTTEHKWLLIFDNVEAWSAISSYWPPSSRSQSSIIVTAQTFSGGWAKHQIPLDSLNAQVGSDLLLHQRGIPDLAFDNPSRKQAEEISKLLGGSPLWINQAAGLMNIMDLDFQDFLGMNQTSSSLFGDSNMGENWRYPQAVSKVFDRLLEKLPTDSLELLFMLSFMSPDNIRQDMLLAEHKFKELSFLDPENKARFLFMIGKLAEGKLIKLQKGVKVDPSEEDSNQTILSMHRGVQIGLVQKLNKDPDVRQNAFDKVVILLREQYPPPTKLMQPESQSWSLITKILPHILSLSSAFDSSQPPMQGDKSQYPIEGSIRFAELLVDVGGMNMYDRGFNADAEALLTRAELILNHIGHPANSPIRGNIATVRGLISDVVGISARAEGERIRKETIAIREEVHKNIPLNERTVEDEIVLYNAQTDYICSLQQFNRFEEVAKRLKKCLSMYKSWGSEEEYPYEYAKYYNHMGYVYLYEGRDAEAVEASRRGSELMAMAEPNTQMSVLFTFDWATILFQAGNTADAFEEHYRLLTARIKGCGELNVLTLQSRLHIGIMYYLVKDYRKAESWLRDTLKLNDDILAPTPVENVARAQYYLAQVLFQTDPEDPEALQLDRSAKESLQQLLALDGSNAMSKYRSPPNYPILFDYIVPWETRLVTPRKEKVGLLLAERVEVVNRSKEDGNEPELETATEGASPSALPA